VSQNFIQQFVWVCTIGWFSGALWATPYLPAHDDIVLEVLPYQLQWREQRELKQLRRQYQQDRRNVPVATSLAQAYISVARQQNDPRYYGYAEAVLQPWWRIDSAPSEVLLLKATLLQHYHHFEAALVDLNQVIAQQPNNGQAWLTRATIHQVMGKSNIALKDCRVLSRFTSPLVSATCMSGALSLTGQAQRAYQLLHKTLSVSQTSPAEMVWAWTLLAEIAYRLGQNRTASEHFVKALQHVPDDIYTLGAYADLLLASGKYQQVYKMLNDQVQDNDLLLRLILAEKHLTHIDYQQHVKLLTTRYDAQRRRGSLAHLRSQSRFVLEVIGDAERALTLATQNWQSQREPDDALILLSSAYASQNVSAAQMILDWVEKNNLEDVRLQRLQQLVRH